VNTFNCKSLVLACTLVGALAGPTRPASQTAMELHVVRGESPHSSVAIRNVSLEEVGVILRGKLAPLARASFWLENNSNRGIVGIATTWAVTGKDGSTHMKRFTADSFLLDNRRPVLEAHHRMLVGPRMWVPQELIERYAASPYFARVQNANLERILEEFTRAAAVRVEIDSVIFADGEVVGSNRTRFDSEITRRKAASETVLAALDAAGPDWVAQKSALLRIISERIAPSENSVVWQHRFAQQLLQARDVSGVADYLRHLPDPPVFRWQPTTD
jgi:hypothetical protein